MRLCDIYSCGLFYIHSIMFCLFFRLKLQFMERPASLPDMTIVKGPRDKPGVVGGGGGGGGQRNNNDRRRNDFSGGGGGGGSHWDRGAAPPRRTGQTQQNDNGGGKQWSRGQAQPKEQQQTPQQGSGGGKGGQGGHRGQQQPLYDGPVAPLVQTENHWKPTKNTSPMIVAEKQVKSILNKMTKEKFAKLSEQMIALPIRSYEMLEMMIKNVFDKAIDEPSFGDIYADLCVRLSHSPQVSNIVHMIESDEEPPTESEAAPDAGESSSYTVYRWSNDVSTTDSEIIGPFETVEACFDAAQSENEQKPKSRGDLELELVSTTIKRGKFVKIMKVKDGSDYYVVYFRVEEAKECGQQLSPQIFLSLVECRSDAKKENSFKRTLLNKCEEEFNKNDIYEDWKKEKKEYEEKKKSMTGPEQAEMEEELQFRRIRIKKQMLGNVKFIGQLFKVRLLKEKVIRYCIASLLKLDAINVEAKTPDYVDNGDRDIDEEDHEAICSILATIGLTIDTPASADFMKVCFTKIASLSTDKALSARSRFMYKDVIDLRENKWVPRRKEEKAKTLEEIRKDVESEERRQAQLSAQADRGGYGGRGSGGRGNSGGDRRSMPSNRARQSRPIEHIDEEGFTTIVAGAKTPFTSPKVPTAVLSRSSSKPTFSALQDKSSGSSKPSAATATALSTKELEKIVKSMRTDFMSEGRNIDELLLTWDKMATSPGAGKTLVMSYMERMPECKDDERNAICQILVILFEKSKLLVADIQTGMADTIVNIEMLAEDAPRVYEYFAKVLSEMLRINAIDLPWLCSQCKKAMVEFDTKAPERILKETLMSLCKNDVDAARRSVQNCELTLTELIGSEAWNTIASSL
jgi:translation initiation factor 4G